VREVSNRSEHEVERTKNALASSARSVRKYLDVTSDYAVSQNELVTKEILSSSSCVVVASSNRSAVKSHPWWDDSGYARHE
jgi:hypothetical protein